MIYEKISRSEGIETWLWFWDQSGSSETSLLYHNSEWWSSRTMYQINQIKIPAEMGDSKVCTVRFLGIEYIRAYKIIRRWMAYLWSDES